MGEPLTQNPTVLKRSSAVPSRSTPATKQPERRHPTSFRPSQPLPEPAMKRQTEITRFAIFLFCSLAPLVSLAPTSEDGKTTTGQRHSTSRMRAFLVLQKQATTLLKNYNACSTVTPKTVSWLTADPQVKAMVKKIPECPPLDAGCCMHVFYNILQTIRNDPEAICGKNFTQAVNASVIQLNVTMTELEVPYTCRSKDLPQKVCEQFGGMNAAKKTKYTWLALQKYEQFMQNATKINSAVGM
nr:uncharacterized protein LOC125183982 [Anser cygnoides]